LRTRLRRRPRGSVTLRRDAVLHVRRWPRQETRRQSRPPVAFAPVGEKVPQGWTTGSRVRPGGGRGRGRSLRSERSHVKAETGSLTMLASRATLCRKCGRADFNRLSVEITKSVVRRSRVRRAPTLLCAQTVVGRKRSTRFRIFSRMAAFRRVPCHASRTRNCEATAAATERGRSAQVRQATKGEPLGRTLRRLFSNQYAGASLFGTPKVVRSRLAGAGKLVWGTRLR